jgi:hypothetical protein
MGMKPRKKPTKSAAAMRAKKDDPKKDDPKRAKKELAQQEELVSVALRLSKNSEEAFTLMLGTAIRLSNICGWKHEQVRSLVELNLAQLRERDFNLAEVASAVSSMISAELGEEATDMLLGDVLMTTAGRLAVMAGLDPIVLTGFFEDALDAGCQDETCPCHTQQSKDARELH